MKQFASTGKKVAMAALPLALGSMFRKAYGQSTSGIINILNFALAAAYLERELYSQGLTNVPGDRTVTEGSTSVLIKGVTPYATRTVQTQLSVVQRQGLAQAMKDEENHITLLTKTIIALGGTPRTKPKIDLTGGGGSFTGPYASAVSDAMMFLLTCQTFSDTGVRAFKGQVPNLITNNEVLKTTQQIHSIEARHVAWFRTERKRAGVDVKPWITLADPVAPANLVNLFKANYEAAPQQALMFRSEENFSHAGVNVANLPAVGGGMLGNVIASESFDEPLSMQRALSLFGNPDNSADTQRFLYVWLYQ